jgi:hypothetical protein
MISCAKGMTACHVVSEVCPENLKAGPEVLEATVFTFKESSDEAEAADLEETSGAMLRPVTSFLTN